MTSAQALLREARSSSVLIAAIDYLLQRGYTLERARRACRPYGTPRLRVMQNIFLTSGAWTCPTDVTLVQAFGRPAKTQSLIPINIPVIPGTMYTVTIGAAAGPEISTRVALGSTLIAFWDNTVLGTAIDAQESNPHSDGLLILEYLSGLA